MNLFVLFLRKLVEIICRKLPLQDKVVFDNYGGLGMGDDPKYIALELLRRKTKLKLYWIVDNKNIKVSPGIKTIKLKSLSYVYHVMTAKVLVDNTKSSHHLQKHKGQYYIQTWHATLALKKVEQDVYNLGQYYIINAVRHSIDTDLMYSNNEFQKYRYENSYWYHGPVIKCDVPRMSILLNTPSGLRQKVYKQLGIPEGKKLLLYAPTFRGQGVIGPVFWDYHRIIEAFAKKFGKNVVLLLRLHPNIISEASHFTYDETVVNATVYPDMQELLAVVDVLITDYSSSMFDYGITGRPVFLFCKDLKEYSSNDRELEFSLDELPFSLSQTMEDFEKKIEQFTKDEYITRIKKFYESIGYVDSGHGAETIADIIEKQIR